MLTTDAMRAIIAAKRATEELKKHAKIAQKQAKKGCQATAVIAKKQVEVRKKTYITAVKLKKVTD